MRTLALLALLLFTGCAGSLDRAKAVAELGPPAMVNPYVLARVPLCSKALTASQRERLSAAMRNWNRAFPEGHLSHSTSCLPVAQPVVRIDSQIKRAGYTTPDPKHGWAVSFGSDRQLTECVATHELGHYLGLIKHATPGESAGPMSDESRDSCEPSAEDLAILRRTYFGKNSF